MKVSYSLVHPSRLYNIDPVQCIVLPESLLTHNNNNSYSILRFTPNIRICIFCILCLIGRNSRATKFSHSNTFAKTNFHFFNQISKFCQNRFSWNTPVVAELQFFSHKWNSWLQHSNNSLTIVHNKFKLRIYHLGMNNFLTRHCMNPSHESSENQ